MPSKDKPRTASEIREGFKQVGIKLRPIQHKVLDSLVERAKVVLKCQ